jgi:hypothetical protein
MKPKLLVSFSGGETSAYMAQWLWNHKRDEYDMIFVFANTGEENEETLRFVHQCELHFGFPVVWVEAVVNPENRQGTRHKIVDFNSACRDGKPFEAVIKKFGIPNMATPHCTREMKERPIRSYAKSIGWLNYETAIGIRADEPKRVKAKFCALKLLYPLVHMQPMTKPKINFWWSQQHFRLQLKGYQGNCKTCWKKSDNKLFQIAKENLGAYNFFGKMELRYDQFIPESRLELMRERGELSQSLYPVRFFRGNRSVQDIINASRSFTKEVLDDAMQFDENESCEVFSCGE